MSVSLFIFPVSHSSLLSIIPTVRIILPHCFHLHFKCFYKCVKRLIHYVGMTSNENIVMCLYMWILVVEQTHEPCMYEKLPGNKLSIFALCFGKVFFSLSPCTCSHVTHCLVVVLSINLSEWVELRCRIDFKLTTKHAIFHFIHDR